MSTEVLKKTEEIIGLINTAQQRLRENGATFNKQEHSQALSAALQGQKNAKLDVAMAKRDQDPWDHDFAFTDDAEDSLGPAPYQRSMDAQDERLIANKAYSRMTLARPAPGDPVRNDVQRFQDLNDALYMGMKCFKRAPWHFYEWQEYMRLIPTIGSKMFGKKDFALNTGTALQGGNWVPTILSSQLIDKFRQALRVTAIFERRTLPSAKYEEPLEGADAIAFKVPERTADNPNLIDSTVYGYFPATGFQTEKIAWAAVKMGARTSWSTEQESDSVIAMLPTGRNKMALAMARGLEQVLIDGDKTSPHIDEDVTSVHDVRMLLDGLRIYADQNAASEIDAGGLKFNPLTHGINAQKAMGKYGRAVKTDLTWVMNSDVMYNILTNTNFLTADKYGNDRLTLLTGEVGRLFGIPVVESEFIRNDLDAGSAGTRGSAYDTASGGVHNRSIALLILRPLWRIGDLEQVTLEDFKMPIVGQRILVAQQRLDFKPTEQKAGNVTVNMVYNIDTSNSI